MSCQQRDPSTPVQISNIYTATMMDRFVFGESCHHHLFLNCHLNSRSWWMIPVIPYSRHIPSDRPFSSSGDHRPHKLLLILLSYVSWTTFMAPFIGTERKCSAVNVQEGGAAAQENYIGWAGNEDDRRREGSVVSTARHNSGADIAPKKLKRIFVRCRAYRLSIHTLVPDAFG